MDFFKLLKTLNSAQSSWQISLAIVLGMISGFLPLTTPLNFLLLFIAFAVNIPLAIFFLFTLVFSGLALILDPIFASLGYEILTATGLKETFTAMYNYTPTLWSSFNYTILMGSLIIALPLALTLFPVLNTLIDKYRDVLEAKFKESKYFSWLNPYNEKNLEKKPGFMRWWAAALFLIIVTILTTIILFLIDPVIKVGLEYSLSKATKRTVQIDSVESTLLEAKLQINNLSLISNSADSNDINVDKIELQLNTEHLLQKKIDFEILSLGNITFKTKITKRVEKKEDSTTTNKDEKKEASFKAPKLPNVDDLIAKEGLKSVDAAKEIETNIATITKKWQDTVKGDAQKKKIASLKKQIKDLEKKAKKVKDINQITAILKDADKLKKDIKSLDKELEQLNVEYKKDKKLLTRYVKEIKTLPIQDYNHLLSKYSLDQNGAMNLIGTHFSGTLEKYLRMGSKYYEIAKPYISSDEEEEETPEQQRMKGKWIKYTNTEPYPDFVIQKLYANIIYAPYTYTLLVRDISDNQKLYKKPITGEITSTSDDYKSFDINFEHNELKAVPVTTVNTNIKEYKLDSFNAIDSLSIEKAKASERSKIIVTDYSVLDAKIALDFKDTALVYSASASLVNDAIKDILSNISSFNVDASIAGTIKEPKIRVSSDLDKKLMKGLKQQASKEVQKYKKKLKIAINKEFKKQVGDIDIEGFEEIGDLLDENKDTSKTLEKLLKKNVSKEAMQKKLQDKALKSLGKKFKLPF